VPVCIERNIGVIGMKGLGGGYPHGIFLQEAGLQVEECFRYCLSLPIASQVVGINSMEQLMTDIAIARNFKPMSATEKKKLLAKVKDVAGDGRFERFKSTLEFEGPHHRKQHGFAVSA
jgi:predicted aldo/keto reductase-like oxidoreductase